MRLVYTMDNYLGLFLIIGQNKIDVFRPIIDRLTNRIKERSKRLLSYGGKETFIKSVLQSLPTHSLSLFLSPSGIMENMVSKIRSYWWEIKNRGRGRAMVN